MSTTCVHSCKGLCNALEVAKHREEEAIKEYRSFQENCDYPEVKQLLDELIVERERGLKLLQETKDILKVKFDTIDDITESFL